MKPLKTICLAICSMASTFSWSQETPFSPSLEIRFAPFSLIDPTTPSIQPGVQLNAFKRFSFSADFGYPINRSFKPYKLNWEYFKLRSEVKFFLSAQKHAGSKGLACYTSFEGFYIPEKYRIENGWYNNADGNRYTYDYNDIHKTVMGFCLKLGGEYLIKDRFILDWYLGAGYRNVNFHHNRHIETVADPIFEEFFSSRDQDEGPQPRPHFAAGIKVGYLLRRDD